MSSSDDKLQCDEHASGNFLAVLGGETEAELAQFRALVASESHTIAALDLNQTFVSWNRGGELLFGYPASEMVGRKLGALVAEISEPLARLARRNARGETVELNAKLRNVHGHLIQVMLTASPMHNQAGEVVGTAMIIVAGNGSGRVPRHVSRSRRPVVLIVDDDADSCQSLAEVLSEVALDARIAQSAAQALQLLKELHVDVLVSDQCMPVTPGTQLLEIAAARYPGTARILFTGQASTDVLIEAVNRARVVKVLLKSMHPVAIRDEIAAVASDTRRRYAWAG
jgi:PAS domain S-box-containing protein